METGPGLYALKTTAHKQAHGCSDNYALKTIEQQMQGWLSEAYIDEERKARIKMKHIYLIMWILR
jgi:hypothetical protein